MRIIAHTLHLYQYSSILIYLSTHFKVTLLQIAVPSRTDVKEYQDLKEELDQLVGRINGRFTTPNWSPIRYIYGCVGQDELAAFYRFILIKLRIS
jgi:trehalose 6-phosphate synthase/phosphatase